MHNVWRNQEKKRNQELWPQKSLTACQLIEIGDKILCCHDIPGDSWRHRHDTVKMAIYQEACLSKVPVDCEVYGLFGDLLPAELMEEGGELQ